MSYSRRFIPGTNDEVQVSAGALSGLDGGPITIAMVVRFLNVTSFQRIIRARTSGGGEVWAVAVDTSQFYYAAGGFAGGISGLAINTWYLYVITKPDGTVAFRDHLCNMETNTWTHADRGSVADSTAGAVDNVLFSDSGARLNANLVAAAVWDTVLDDTAVEGLRSGLPAWLAANPLALWQFMDSPVNDRTKNGSNQTAVTGTIVEAVYPAAFSFDSLGWNPVFRHAPGPGRVSPRGLIVPWRGVPGEPVAEGTPQSDDAEASVATGLATNAVSIRDTATVADPGMALGLSSDATSQVGKTFAAESAMAFGTSPDATSQVGKSSTAEAGAAFASGSRTTSVRAISTTVEGGYAFASGTAATSTIGVVGSIEDNAEAGHASAGSVKASSQKGLSSSVEAGTSFAYSVRATSTFGLSTNAKAARASVGSTKAVKTSGLVSTAEVTLASACGTRARSLIGVSQGAEAGYASAGAVRAESLIGSADDMFDSGKPSFALAMAGVAVSSISFGAPHGVVDIGHTSVTVDISNSAIYDISGDRVTVNL